jgi:hypothetical protein
MRWARNCLRDGLRERADASSQSPWRRLRQLPFLERMFTVVLLGCAAAPPAALLSRWLWPSRLAERISANPEVTNLIACGIAAAVLVAIEPPRSASLLAYARQLRARFLELQSIFDADDRRRPGEGKEKEDDRVSFEP